MANDMEHEVASQLDLDVLRYSKVWEDHRVLSEGLDINPEDDVVSITSSGDNVLNLLLDEPRTIVAIDMSHAQNSTLEIKIAGIKKLEFPDFLKLLGVSSGSEDERMSLYRSLREDLPEYAQVYWDKRRDLIVSGIVHSGRLDQYSQSFAEKCTSIVGQTKLDEFFNSQSLEEQQSRFQQWPLKKLKEAMVLHISKKEQANKGRSVVQLKYVKMSDEQIGEQFWKRLVNVCSTVPVHDNFYLSWWLRGKRETSNPDYNPIYLKKSSFDKLKHLVNRVRIVTSSLESYFQDGDVSFSKFNLSDVFEYMSEESSDALFGMLASKSRRGGRIAFWNLMCRRESPTSLRDKLRPMTDLSKALYVKDRVFFWDSFHVIQVV